MQEIIQEGKTREEALNNALEKLGVTIDKVEVEELEGQRDRFFGLLISKNIRLRVRVLDNQQAAPAAPAAPAAEEPAPESAPEEESLEPREPGEEEHAVQEFVQTVLQKMDVALTANVTRIGDEIAVSLDGEDAGMIIGKFGQTLDSLQYLANVILGKCSDENLKVTVNVGDYRERREESLRRMARAMASKVVKSRKSVTLAPMSPQDRRIVHLALSNFRNVSTGSEGVGPNRRVIISYKK